MVSFHKDKYVNRLVELATQLGIEDVSNNKLISNFFANYDFYASILEKSMSDGLISVEDKVELYKYRASIITDDLKIIGQKKPITDEDVQILTEILKIVDLMRDDEENLPSLI